jgi:hypothetical protein
MALAVLTSAGGPMHLADMGGWIWAAIILFWIVTSAVSALRRGLKQVRTAVPEEIAVAEQDAEQLPQVRRMSTATREITDEVRADLTQATTDFGSSTSATGVEAALRDVAADIQAAKAAATLTVSAARAAATSPAVHVSAGQALTGTLASIHDLRAGAPSLMPPLLAPTMQQPPLATAFVGGEAATAFHDTAGLAFAIVAQAVIGPCAGLREEPMQPGGW